jgi:hypothetical protein
VSGQFSHVSLLIDLDGEWWWTGSAALLDPVRHFPRRGRTYLHETLHFWQQLAHGYLIALAEEDWRRMLASERGQGRTPGPLRNDFQSRMGAHGFTASDLCECLARFWEIVAIGPETVLRHKIREERLRNLNGSAPPQWVDAAERPTTGMSFEVAMETGGRYSHPYLAVRDLFGHETSQVLFPLVAHFALQTPSPVEIFEYLVEHAGSPAARTLVAAGLRGSLWERPDAIETAYRSTHQFCREAVRAVGADLVDGRTRFRDSPLQENPAYQACFRMLDKLAGRVDVDVALAMPVGPPFRPPLATGLLPLCVRFGDRLVSPWALAMHEVRGPAEVFEPLSLLASASAAVQERWDAFLRLPA